MTTNKLGDELPLNSHTMFKLAHREARNRYPGEFDGEYTELQRKLLAVLDELFPKEFQTELIVRNKITEYLEQETREGNLIPLPGNQVMRPKDCFALSYDDGY